MYGIRYQEGDYSRLTSLVFFNMCEAQEYIDSKNDLLVKEERKLTWECINTHDELRQRPMPGRYVLETLILMDPENE
jgi:hypothetical protein